MQTQAIAKQRFTVRGKIVMPGFPVPLRENQFGPTDSVVKINVAGVRCGVHRMRLRFN